MKLRKNHPIHWIASFAILMSALAPAVSQALSAYQGGDMFIMEICTSAGGKVIQASVNGEGESELPAMEMKQCPYCVVQAVYITQLGANLNFAVPLDLTIFPKLFYQSPRLLFAWISLPSQAPPQLA